ncbi:DUF3601 domain-containing protein [Enterococcus faecalis]|uniref:DUF3601 domain-containing protein n=1 Tax=Enterococcus faecalis ATCC 6055 TaxID=1169311 RepID=R3HNZ2_ENTFL|nr:DUF3601 domain-containing protein [Enterococcus faecalis]EOK07272.1 hypothetical protein WOU_03111 [Enterococcus faecalis ATCC 6055]
MKINWLKLIGLIVLDVFFIGIVKEVGFNPDFYLPSMILEGIIYNFTHLSFLGILGGLGMVAITISLCFMALTFIIFSWGQLKNCFQLKHNKQVNQTILNNSIPEKRKYTFLVPDKKYKVIKTFIDYYGKNYFLGTKFYYITYTFSPYEDGLILWFTKDYKEPVVLVNFKSIRANI